MTKENRTAKQDKRPVGRPARPMPEPIPDTPENVARALMATPPPADHDWEYLKDPRTEGNPPRMEK